MEPPTDTMTQMDQLREFATLPWIRCPSCGKVTSRLQKKYDAYLEEKQEVYYNNLETIFATLLDQGFEEMAAQKLADQQARVIADVTFNRHLRQDLGLTRYCCMKTLQNPALLPLGSGVELDPEVDVGQRMSQLRLDPKTETTPVKRIYRAI